ncbi:hypothetical protein D3C76_1327280 [compost metagenome]
MCPKATEFCLHGIIVHPVEAHGGVADLVAIVGATSAQKQQIVGTNYILFLFFRDVHLTFQHQNDLVNGHAASHVAPVAFGYELAAQVMFQWLLHRTDLSTFSWIMSLM